MKKISLLIILLILMTKKTFTQNYGRIEESTLKCVVNINGNGTGFLLSKPIPNQNNLSKGLFSYKQTCDW